MQEGDGFWIQVFQDKSVAPEALDGLHDQLMAEILSGPVNFAARMELARRRKWGLAFVGSWLGLGLAFLLLFVFLPQVWLSEIWGKLQFVFGLGVALASFWQEYSWHLIGLIITAGFLIAGFKGNSPLTRTEDTRVSW